MKELELKYGCNPNQKPSRIYMLDGDLPVTVLNGKPGYINFMDAFNSWQLVKALKKATGAKVHMDLADAKGDQMYPLTPDLIDAPWPAGNSEYQVDELTFRIWHTPGHTPGGVVIPCRARSWRGDTRVPRSRGPVALPGGSPAEMQRSLALVADLPLPDETTVYPGHESFTTLGQERRSNPYLMGEVF